MKDFQATLVRNFSFRGNSNSVVKINNILIPVVAITLIRKVQNDPNSSHWRNKT